MQHPHFWSLAGVASGLYDYIQRSVWASNDAFANFLYYSPLASALAGVGRAKELRLSTDLLMVNPNKGFKWHQDNQNGPIDAFSDMVPRERGAGLSACAYAPLTNTQTERLCARARCRTTPTPTPS